MTDGEKDNAGVMTPPRLIYGAGLLTGLGFDFLWPLPLLPDRGQYLVGFIMIGMSGALVAWPLHPSAIRELNRFARCGRNLP